MKLYLVRHANAEPAGACGDFARRLTLQGRLQAQQTGRALRLQGVPVDAVFSSPAHRAAETAELLAGEFNPSPRLEIVELLYSGAPWEDLLQAMPDLQRAESIALVSHLPFIEHLARSLLAETADLRFLPSALYGLEFDGPPRPSTGRLSWVHAPSS